MDILSFFRTVYDSYCPESSSLSTYLGKWLLCIKHSTSSVVNFLTFTRTIFRKPKVKLSSGTAFWIESQYSTTFTYGSWYHSWRLGFLWFSHASTFHTLPWRNLTLPLNFFFIDKPEGSTECSLKGPPNLVMLDDLSVKGLLTTVKWPALQSLVYIILYIWVFVSFCRDCVLSA